LQSELGLLDLFSHSDTIQKISEQDIWTVTLPSLLRRFGWLRIRGARSDNAKRKGLIEYLPIIQGLIRRAAHRDALRGCARSFLFHTPHHLFHYS